MTPMDILSTILRKLYSDNPLVVDIKPGNVYDNHKRNLTLSVRLSMDFKEFKD